MTEHPYGYVFVHFREEPDGHAEKVFMSLSDGNDPLTWHPLNGGEALLQSPIGTTGVRDPVIARDEFGIFHILATDLRVWNGDGLGWDSWQRFGSRSLVIWDSDDLITWSEPRLVEVAPTTAGMAWAPEVTVDPETGERIVLWASRMYDESDVDHTGESRSRILCARTRDFVDFTSAETLVDSGHDIIDTAIVHHDGRVYRVTKQDDDDPQSLRVYIEVGSGLFTDDYRTLATRIGAELFDRLEGPIIFRDNLIPRWYLFLDQYSVQPQGYIAFYTDDLNSGTWTPVPSEEFRLRPATKHGGILPITREEWNRLDALR